MRLPVNAPLRIHVPPIFPWERGQQRLVIRAQKGFHPRHGTSRLCLELLARHRVLIRHKSFLDVGCGSGILALAAAHLGADWVVGVDIYEPSIRAAVRNAGENGLGGRSAWVVRSVEAVRGPFAAVAANLPWPVWLRIGGEIMGRVASDGLLLVSGFQDLQLAHLQGQLHDAGFFVVDRAEADESFFGVPPSGSFTWMALVALRRNLRRRGEP
ncbi:Ribosomal protein L11 methyltransferase (PrmA) [Desulfacinum hydrothermale DSM 13146]|uniref:Ribosomal protein L11 methyltransferase (PrmA) n=1 Tax=Desulfacinum hydrothermale DSM 13146 TaxID=1121390 RepID=A0A1W1XPE0_9BACT|nr:50S ribosomal protein L11 methyltransferase [Desulfacinum hydrothermale]SMC25839.1 Ribosomal protein L11 methyltransferase (PrmA) [Desulfacinum hydrothermale DSM 13146]